MNPIQPASPPKLPTKLYRPAPAPQPRAARMRYDPIAHELDAIARQRAAIAGQALAAIDVLVRPAQTKLRPPSLDDFEAQGRNRLEVNRRLAFTLKQRSELLHAQRERAANRTALGEEFAEAA